jgi:hypothetical protein
MAIRRTAFTIMGKNLAREFDVLFNTIFDLKGNGYELKVMCQNSGCLVDCEEILGIRLIQSLLRHGDKGLMSSDLPLCIEINQY